MFYIILIISLALAVGIPLAIAHERKTRENWRQAADTLGLQFYGGELLKTKRIEGILRGNSVRIDTFTKRSGKHSTTYTRVRVRYPRPLGLGLKVTREGFFSGLGKLLGFQDINVGEDDFDRAAVIKGSDPRRIQAFLTPARRMRIQQLLRNYPEIEINDDEIFLRRQGVIRQSQRLVQVVRAMERMAWFLTGDRVQDESITAAMEAQDAGHPDEALRILRESKGRLAISPDHHEEEIVEAQLVEEHLMEGKILHMAGRYGEAEDYFAQARREAPEDPEIELWASPSSDSVKRRLDAVGDAGTPSIPAELPLDAAGFCRVIFKENVSNFVANDLFEQHYAGRPIEWSGPLRRAERMSYDMVFGDDEACRATFEIHAVDDGSYLRSAIKAFVKLPPDQAEALRSQVGEEKTFTGRLLKLDAFMRNVYVEDGAVRG